MTHILLLNLVFFTPATCGATAFALLVYRFVLRSEDPPDPAADDGPGGAKTPQPSAGPDDLARSA
jgi:hypothetical protein